MVNYSNVDLKAITYTLGQIVSYTSETPKFKSKHQTIVIQEKCVHGVAKQTKETFQVALIVPPVPPTNQTTIGRIIHIQYELTVEASTAGGHSIPSLCIPIVIGTIPLTISSGGASLEPSSEELNNYGSPDTFKWKNFDTGKLYLLSRALYNLMCFIYRTSIVRGGYKQRSTGSPSGQRCSFESIRVCSKVSCVQF